MKFSGIMNKRACFNYLAVEQNVFQRVFILVEQKLCNSTVKLEKIPNKNEKQNSAAQQCLAQLSYPRRKKSVEFIQEQIKSKALELQCRKAGEEVRKQKTGIKQRREQFRKIRKIRKSHGRDISPLKG